MGVFFGLKGKKAKTPKAANIHFTDLEQKVEGGFGLRGDGFLDSLVPDIFSPAVLLDLGTDRRPYAVAAQANKD